MHLSTLVVQLGCLCIAGHVSAIAIANRASHGFIESRSILQGWSLQSTTCPSGTTTCGSGGSCCPSSLFCQSAANDEVSACCTTNSACRGDIEGAPKCADSSWSLWKGYQGNGFCCEAGMIGIYDYHINVAGSCVSSAAAASATSAQLVSAGSTVPGSTPTSSIASSSHTSTKSTVRSTPATESTSSTSKTAPASSTAPAASTGKPVFFHYMIGTITDAHCEQDIKDAMALGADAFALNINTVSGSWALTTTASLFNWANALGFKLFFSFDMTGFSDPSQFTTFLEGYVSNVAYFKYNGLPLVSTFNGGFLSDSTWKTDLENVMSSAGTPVYFAPAFQDVTITSSFFQTYPSLNGAMNWNSWPQNTQGDIVVPTVDDQTLLTAAHAAGKTMIMGVSPLQFKHYDSGDNWYRRGEQNLEYRFGQVLSIQPDMIELQTWNDAGESHYMGNSWPEPIEGTPIPGYTTNYDHTAYNQILPSFISAWKRGATDTSTMYPTNGAKVQGAFWHHTLLAQGTCPADSLGPPQGVGTVEDKVTAVILVAEGNTGFKAIVTSGGTQLGTQVLAEGYNGFSFGGMTTGNVVVAVHDSAGNPVVQGTGPIAVVSTAAMCNYNFQVVALA